MSIGMTPAGAPVATGDAIFCAWAPRLRRAGFAVLPIAGKRPLISGFRKWQSAPSPATMERWAAKYPTANVAYLPGLSGLVVLDADDAEACRAILDLFGGTPGRVRTRRGMHFLYRHVGADLGRVESLKAYGINADLKHGRSIVVAPPSQHPEDPNMRYAWDDCDETVINNVPVFDLGALRRLVGQGSKKIPNAGKSAPRPPLPHAPFRNESRGLALNDHLVRTASAWDDIDSALAIAKDFNAKLADLGREPLDEQEVLERTLAVLKDLEAGKIERRRPRRAAAFVDADEVRLLTAAGRNGDAAVTLLTLLRAEHGARVKRGETFGIDAKAMAQAKTLGRWSARKYRASRDLLLQTGYLSVVAKGWRGRPAQYTLVKPPPQPTWRPARLGEAPCHR